MAKISTIERAVRGMERCGFRVYAVGTAESPQGLLTMFPHGDEGQGATPSTVYRWEREWKCLGEQEGSRTIFDYLIKTGRAEEARRSG